MSIFSERKRNKVKSILQKSNPTLLKRILELKRKADPFLCKFPIYLYGVDGILSKVGSKKRELFPFLPSRYAKIKDLHGKHKGEDCFIIATGPSLVTEDLNKLNGKLSIGLNSVVYSYDKTQWRPTYYLLQDPHVFDSIAKDRNPWDGNHHIIISHWLCENIQAPKDVFIYRLDMNGHSRASHPENVDFSADVFARICDGYTVTYTAIQLAVYMGFKRVFLLGVDYNYSGKSSHGFGYKALDAYAEETIRNEERILRRMGMAYEKARESAEKNGVKIYNATRGGNLEIFERVTLEDVI